MTSSPLRYSDAKAGFGSWRNVMVTIFTDRLEAPHLAEIHKNHADMLSRYPDGYLGVVIIEPSARMLKPDLRQPTVDLMVKVNKSNLAGCYVFNGGGVMLTSVRAVVSAMILASRPARPNKVFGELAEAAEWLIRQNEALTSKRESYSAHDLLQALLDLERHQLARATQNAAS